MNNYKIKNKDIKHTDFRQTLKMVHEETLNKFDEKTKSLPSLRLKLNTLSGSEYDVLKREIFDIENKISETEYLLKAMPFLSTVKVTDEKNNEKNNSDLSNFVERKGSVLKGQMYSDYMSACHGVIISNEKTNENLKDPTWCYTCNIEKYVELSSAQAVCPECGNAEQYQDEIGTPQYSDTIQVLSPFAYQRINHFKEFLSQLQAKNFMTEIPADVTLAIQKELKKERITDPNDITPTRIRRYLKKLHLNKYYEHVNSLTCKMSGRTPPRLSNDVEYKLIQMFKEIQSPFERHCPEGRKNFLSYSYTLHKMCQIIGRTDLIIHFPLLKSREKNYVQDCIWKGICGDLGWQYISSV